MKIGIVGLGLIGGSLGLDLQSQGHEVMGVSRRPATCQQAIDRGVVHRASPHLDSLTAAEIVFLCTPLDHLIPVAQELIPHLSSHTILTDVGSAKAAIVQTLEPLWPNFIGGHPMAGKAESGLAVAQLGLFQGNPYVLTPTCHTPPEAITVVTRLVQSLQADLYTCSAEAHDRSVAWISHLPVMVSASLIAACDRELDPTVKTLAQQLASSGFRDTSRVGGGSPDLGVLMARYNRAALLAGLAQYQETIAQVQRWIEQENWEALMAFLEQTQAQRPPYLVKTGPGA